MSTAAESLAHPVQVQTRDAWSFFGFAVATCVIYLLFPGDAVAAVCFGSAAAGSAIAIGIGVRRHKPRKRAAWKCVLLASLLFMIGGGLRTAERSTNAVPELLAAAFTIGGYVAVAAALTIFLRARNVHASSDTVLDTVLVGLGATLASWVLLIAPVTDHGSIINVTTAVVALYPILDSVLLALLVHLTFTTAPGDRTFGLLGTSLLAIFVGDLGYAVTTAGFLHLPDAVLDAPFLIAFGALGAGALHPSMKRISLPQPGFAYRGRRRVPGLVVALVLASVALAAVPAHHTLDQVVRAVLFGTLLLGVLARSERAVRRHATSEQAARHKSTHDDLTGLPNRVLLHSRVTRQLEANTGIGRLSLLFMDLDGFKFVNDSYGHSVGDELLVAAAERLLKVVRPEDVVARYGGDEFVVTAPLERAGAEGLADRILAVLSEPFVLSVGRVYVSASIGIARASPSAASADIEGLIREADAAMYHAKARGRGGYAFFDDSLRARARMQIETSTALRDALGRKEFEVFYQPIVSLTDRSVVGYEALLRWYHDGELRRPDHFIPIAEASNIIVSIGAWVLRTACEQLATWREQGHTTLHMAVNVSARQLRDYDLVHTVESALSDTGLPGTALWLELTETALVDDTDTALRTLQALQDLGVVLCVDDFGTGYSALGYLQRFPISVVKIDGAFVRALNEQLPESSIVGAIEKMSRALGMNTVAEGVETTLQEAQLRSLGCEMAQGWLFGYPLPAREIIRPQALPVSQLADLPEKDLVDAELDGRELDGRKLDVTAADR
ncbi:EAL domain-containing protein [Rhodococcus sp. X156]|uniref:putative bifunctional diguanylate cyclase/phosphodiesterase n=1 Tax=Rhodococcus sp. X156 TaxID=2499145 RepID=UPI000FD7FC61|nr:EAL domain-containing protein [Rhodococcus sp. X156]